MIDHQAIDVGKVLVAKFDIPSGCYQSIIQSAGSINCIDADRAHRRFSQLDPNIDCASVAATPRIAQVRHRGSKAMGNSEEHARHRSLLFVRRNRLENTGMRNHADVHHTLTATEEGESGRPKALIKTGMRLCGSCGQL